VIFATWSRMGLSAFWIVTPASTLQNTLVKRPESCGFRFVIDRGQCFDKVKGGLTRFTHLEHYHKIGYRSHRRTRQNPHPAGLADESRRSTAQFTLHAPVNELHSIDFKAHTNLLFRLTKKLQGVQHNCSLTVTEFFRLVRRPGVKRGHLPQTARVLTQEKLGNQRIWRTELRQNDGRKASKAL
jgi:hypothetical protein